MRTKQELLLGKQAVALKLLTMEQLKCCIALQEKKSLPLSLIFLTENLIPEQKLRALIKKHLQDNNYRDKGDDLAFCRLALKLKLVAPDALDQLLIQQKKMATPISLMEMVLHQNMLPLQDFLVTYAKTYQETIFCSGCHKEFRLVNLGPGKKLRCKHCKTIFLVPSIEQEISSYQYDSTLETSSEQDEMFAGYEILEEIAQGGMGIVYRAQKKSTGQIVALKVLREAFRSSGEAKQRFAREAQTLSRLKHDYIVSVFEVGIENEIPYFTMDYVNGPPLSSYIYRNLLPLEQVVDIIIKLCQGLQYAHSMDIIHRDIKPSNILLQNGVEPKLTDFGLAKCMDSMTMVTRSGTTLGTPYYMAPEQAKGQLGLVGPRSDLYSLGVVFYELLTGRNPFRGENTVDIYQNILTVEPDPPSIHNPQIRKKLDRICLKAIKKDSFQRYKNAQEMEQELELYKSGKSGWWDRWLCKIWRKE